MGMVLIKSQTHQDQNTLRQNSGEGAKLMTGKYYLPSFDTQYKHVTGHFMLPFIATSFLFGLTKFKDHESGLI